MKAHVVIALFVAFFTWNEFASARSTVWKLSHKSSSHEVWKTVATPRTYCSIVIQKRPLSYLGQVRTPASQIMATETQKSELLTKLNVTGRKITRHELRPVRDGFELSLGGSYIDNLGETAQFSELHRNFRGRGEFVLCSSKRPVDEKSFASFLKIRDRHEESDTLFANARLFGFRH